MRESAFPGGMLTAIPAAAGVLLCLVLAWALARKPSRQLAYFLCFYAISVVVTAAGPLLTPLFKKSGSMGIQAFWSASRVLGLSRYFFLLLFVHSTRRFRATPALNALMSAVVALGIASPFLYYSIIPQLAEIAVVLYCFSYLLVAHNAGDRLAMSPGPASLIRRVLYCTGFFLIGIVLDLVEGIPQASAYVSVGLFAFQPAYLVCVGVAVAAWAIRGIARPEAGPAAAGLGPGSDVSRLPVSRREREVAGLILEGETNAAIAERLFISESTVKKHVNNLFRKLGISSRWELLKLTRGMHPKE